MWLLDIFLHPAFHHFLDDIPVYSSKEFLRVFFFDGIRIAGVVPNTRLRKAEARRQVPSNLSACWIISVWQFHLQGTVSIASLQGSFAKLLFMLKFPGAQPEPAEFLIFSYSEFSTFNCPPLIKLTHPHTSGTQDQGKGGSWATLGHLIRETQYTINHDRVNSG